MTAAQNRARPTRVVTNVDLEIVEHLDELAAERGIKTAALTREMFLEGYENYVSRLPLPSAESGDQ